MPKTAQNQGAILFRLRQRDSVTAVGQATFDRLVETTGLSKTDVVHLALRKLADNYLPAYEKDDGPFTEEQLRSIINVAGTADIPEESFTRRLF